MDLGDGSDVDDSRSASGSNIEGASFESSTNVMDLGDGDDSPIVVP